MSWSCDIHKLRRVNGHPLQLVGTTLFKWLGFDQIESISTETFMLFMERIEAAYLTENAYHNRAHSADVTQTVGRFLHDPTVAALCTDNDKFVT